jgi:amino acid adenylation domain-containing protein
MQGSIASSRVRLSPPAPPSFEPFPKAEIHQGIHERFQKVVRARANAMAVIDGEARLTYTALNERANRIAHGLMRRLGDRVGQVGTVLPNGHELIAALFGIYKANKTFVPLDPSFPADRLAYMAEDAECSAILTDASHAAGAQQIQRGRIPILDVGDLLDQETSMEDPCLPCDPLQLAYIIYTSGTTGRPKGIAFLHRNLLHTKMCVINAMRISLEDRLTHLHSTSFSASVLDIYTSLLVGAQVFPWDVRMRGFTGMGHWLVSNRITNIQWIPTPFRHLLHSLPHGFEFPDVRLVMMGSEPLTIRDVDLFRKHFAPGCVLANQMGTSESYNYAFFFADHATEIEGTYVPGGYPVSEDREVLILDEERRPVAVGEPGEIAIRSRYMSAGYWKRPELTAEKFHKEPEDPTLMTYYSGDVGKLEPDGCLIHLGRKDSQVKLRGFRVELAEIECILSRLDGVKDSAVVCRPDHLGELRLFGYLVAKDGVTLDLARVRDEVARQLPDFMVPSFFTVLPVFPLLPTGKLDKSMLPMPDSRARRLEVEAVQATNPMEQQLCDAFREILKVETVGIDDNFFQIGGDSLQAACLLSRLSEVFGFELRLQTFLPDPTPAGIARAIARNGDCAEAETGGNGKSEDQLPRDTFWRGGMNRLLQLLALYAPGLTTTRSALHRLRGVRIGRGVSIGTSTLIETKHPQLVSIGDNVGIGIRCVIIAHFSDSIDPGLSARHPTVRIEDDVFIGPSVTVLPNVTIGRGAVVAAGSVVNRSVPPLTMVQGNPAEVVAQCGIPLMGHSYEEFLQHLKKMPSTSRNSAVK